MSVNAWWNPWPDAVDRAFQIVQSLCAGSLSIFVQGVGQGFPIYIPVVHSDFIFAAIAEEWGLVGSLSTVLIFVLLAFTDRWLAPMARRPFQRHLAAGISILTSRRCFIVSGVTQPVPPHRRHAAANSYGGSSMLTTTAP
ncbi:MAG: FtsW/RodA/SpoVE family cell cycle protein [Chloroflexi bacterium]|nr:FtsW/RodA/SpoVE family cell cycle protein [Chloroflexota bacterium]